MKNIELNKEMVLKIFLALLILGGGLYSYLSYFWLPVSKKIAEFERKNSEMERQIKTAKATIAKYPDLQKKLSELQSQKEELKKKIPVDKNISELFRVIKRSADKNAIYIESIVPMGVVNEKYYFRITYNMTIKGGYHNIGRFLGEILSQDRILNIENLTIAGGETSVATFILVSYQYMEGV